MLSAEIKNIRLINSRSDRTILKNISFELPDNSVFTILGKNGSGKSTLIKSLTGLLDKNFYSVSGNVTFNGENITGYDYRKLLQFRKHKLRYVFQDAPKSFDPLKKLKYYFDLCPSSEKEIDETLAYFLLPERKNIYTMHPYEVSGGMAQRISFALALLSGAEIIILDEPTSGIDKAIANLFLLKIRDFASLGNNSVLLVTQDVVFAQKVSDKIAFLSEGSMSEFYEAKKFSGGSSIPNLAEFFEANSRLNS